MRATGGLRRTVVLVGVGEVELDCRDDKLREVLQRARRAGLPRRDVQVDQPGQPAIARAAASAGLRAVFHPYVAEVFHPKDRAVP